MIHGVHPRHGTDAEPNSDETGHRQSSHQSASKASLPHRESSSRSGVRTGSTESQTKSKVSPVEPQQSAQAVNHRRQSMELRRSTTDRQGSEVVAKPEAPHPPASASPLTHSGSRHHQARWEEIPLGSVESSVEHAAEQPATRPATAPCRRHRGSARHRRRMAARQRSKLLQLSSSTVPADHSPDQLLNSSHSHSSTGAVAEDGHQQDMAVVDSRLVDEPKVGSPIKSVKFIDSEDASVLDVASVDNDVLKKTPGCRDSADVAVSKTSMSVALTVPSSCHGGIDTSRLKRELPLSNCVPVMHVDFAGRVGRRRCSQEGVVLLDHYVSADAACVCCCSCSQLFSVAEFVRHAHHLYRADVGSDRRLGPCGVASPEWREFQRRRAQFAVGPGGSKTLVSQPPVDHVTQTTAVETAASDADLGVTVEDEKSSILAVDEVGKSTDVENLPSLPVATARPGVDQKPTSTPADSKDKKSAVTDTNPPPPPPVPVTDKVAKSLSDDCSSVDVGLASRPLETIVAASCPASVDEVGPRVTRSRSSSASPAKPSPSVPSLRRPSAAAASGPRHIDRSCKRARMDLTATSPVRHASDVDSIGSRPELRPRPPPRATGPK